VVKALSTQLGIGKPATGGGGWEVRPQLPFTSTGKTFTEKSVTLFLEKNGCAPAPSMMTFFDGSI